ncbi:MAG: NAD-dependent epimerase/dehydratase family protein [Phycisphaerales bacterium]|nr:NAD-dependent epimerase/dehydratase family protein [Phycisphaerales bacterium]
MQPASPTRREFLQTTLSGVAGAAVAAAVAGSIMALGAGSPATAAAARRDPAAAKDGKLRVLILGGTGFLGPHLADICRARGHRVTLFNRGITEKRKGIPVEADDKLLGDRDPTKGDGLKALETGEWDAVIDTSGFYPRHVKASAELLSGRVGQYLFISTISVYAANDTPDADESAPLAKLEDETVEDMGPGGAYYGGLKALCEKAAEAAMPGRVANIRPGFIVGPGDPTDRFTYWPARVDKGGEVLCPGTPDDPVQVIDARDLAAFTVRLAERFHAGDKSAAGVFNATGPAAPLRWGAVLDACKAASPRGGEATLRYVPAAFLAERGVPPGVLPIWIPPEGELAGFHRRSVSKAVAAGLTFRPIGETVSDLLKWWPGELERRVRRTAELKAEAEAAGKPAPAGPDPSVPRAGIPPKREAELLKAWAEHEKAKP